MDNFFFHLMELEHTCHFVSLNDPTSCLLVVDYESLAGFIVDGQSNTHGTNNNKAFCNQQSTQWSKSRSEGNTTTVTSTKGQSSTKTGGRSVTFGKTETKGDTHTVSRGITTSENVSSSAGVGFMGPSVGVNVSASV